MGALAAARATERAHVHGLSYHGGLLCGAADVLLAGVQGRALAGELAPPSRGELQVERQSLEALLYPICDRIKDIQASAMCPRDVP